MHSYSDLGITTGGDRVIFEVPQVSILDVINCPIEVLDFTPGVKTFHGEGRHIVKIRHEGRECKFFTTAAQIKEALDKIPKEKFPFTATIKQQRFGGGAGKMFYFT